MLLRAVSLGFGGYVDLDLKFGEFFNANHTLVVRYLPQYPYAYAGPLLAENGPGRFMIGQGDYRWGTGDFKQVGPSTLFLEVGDERAVYEVPHTAGDDPNGPRLYRDTWQVLAAVREGDTYSLYLNGRRLHPFQDPNVPDPATDVVVGPNRAPQDHAKLRVGRRSRGRGNSNRGYQFYGLVDDVAVYGRAFNRTEVGAIWDAPALTGDEADLIAAWSFDEPEAGDPVPPSTLARPFHVPDEAEIPDHVNPNAAQQLPVYLVPVSPDRDSAVDALQLDTRPSKTHMEVPFGVGEIWRVGQPWHSPGGSHNGFAAFAWDLNRVGEATFDQPIHAAGTGRIRESIQNDDDGGAPGRDRKQAADRPSARRDCQLPPLTAWVVHQVLPRRARTTADTTRGSAARGRVRPDRGRRVRSPSLRYAFGRALHHSCCASELRDVREQWRRLGTRAGGYPSYWTVAPAC